MESEQILKRPPSESMVKQVTELSEALFSLKESAEAGGLPDMHIENILVWYRVTVEQEIAKAEDTVIEAAHKSCECGQQHLATPIRSVQGGITSYCQFSKIVLSQTLKEHKEGK